MAPPPNFDDLIPGGQPKSLSFDDLVPAKPREGRAARLAGLGALGFNDAIADTLGAPVDLVNMLLRGGGTPTAAARAALGKPPEPPNNPIGGSQTFRDVFDYVATLKNRVGDAVDQGSLGPMTEPRTARDVPRDTTEKWVYGGGRGVGGAAGMFVPAAAVAGTAAPNTVTQALASQLAARPAAQAVAGGVGGGVSEVTDNPYAGMAAGAVTPVVASLARRAVTPAIQLNDRNRELADVLRSNGVPLSAGQLSGSGPLRTIESVMGNHPITAWIAGKDAAAQRAAYNRAVTGLTGDAADSVTPQYLADTKERLGRGFNEIAGRNTVNLDDKFLRDVRGAQANYNDLPDLLQQPVFNKLAARLTGEDKPLLDQAISAITGRTMSGQEYQALRARLGAKADSVMGSDSDYGRALVNLQRSLDSAMERSAGKGDAAQWRQLRDQYGAYKTIDETMRATNATGGDIPPTQLWMKSRDRPNQQMQDLARAGQEFVKDTIPNSGTPQRLAAMTLLTGGLGSGGFGMIEPTTAAAAFGLPVAAQALMRSAPGRMASQFPTEDLVKNALAQRLLLESQGGRIAPR